LVNTVQILLPREEYIGNYFSGLQFHPWIDLVPQEKSPTAGLELATFGGQIFKKANCKFGNVKASF
jgi:hypothetical protein